VIWVCPRCHDREHKRFHVFSPNRKALRRQLHAEGFDIEALRRELSIYGSYTSPRPAEPLLGGRHTKDRR